MKRKNPLFIARLGVFGPNLWYDCHFDASKLWEGVEGNSLGVSIVGGAMFSHYDTRQALTHIQCPTFWLWGGAITLIPQGYGKATAVVGQI